ncbi:hypothetical protein E2R68_02760 [Psychromonas sp. RZ22]|uniref:hypothetical protein n=1 Tax=Psychromonas algarum TaxID=2555643 RepID=UPI001067B004|nr:hypothetical protein [Psychromonas sp. RZ22]TEW56029.1 hypothetical protein E2R68_02760 [Psychromonas sp. RZ22]
MFQHKGFISQRLLVYLTTFLIVLIIMSTFISYTSDIAREARINMLKITEMQLKSVNRMLFSRASIHNLQLNERLDASVIDEVHQGGILTLGEMAALTQNISIFIWVERLSIVEGKENGQLVFYPEGLDDTACSLIYQQPFMRNNRLGESERHSARYQINLKEC